MQKDVYIIPRSCREEHLFDTPKGRKCLENNDILSAGLSELTKPYRIERYHYQEHVLLFTRGGAGEISIGNASFPLRLASCCLVPAGLSYKFWTTKKWHLTWFHLPASPRWVRLIKAFRVRPSQNEADLTILCRLFLKERARSGSGYIQALEHYGQLLHLTLNRELQPGGPSFGGTHGARLLNFRETLYEHPEYDWSVGFAASKFGFSGRNLHLLTKKGFGKGVMEMVTEVRLEKAAYLLRSTDWKLDEIGVRVGYQNSFAFSRVFKRYFGISPKSYRQRGGL